MTIHGHVNGGVIVLDNGAALPDGTWVQVTPMPYEAGDPLAVIAAMEAEPHLSPQDVAELERAIAPAKPLAAADKKALRSLLTADQFQALMDIVARGGPDVEAIARIRAASMT